MAWRKHMKLRRTVGSSAAVLITSAGQTLWGAALSRDTAAAVQDVNWDFPSERCLPHMTSTVPAGVDER